MISRFILLILFSSRLFSISSMNMSEIVNTIDKDFKSTINNKIQKNLDNLGALDLEPDDSNFPSVFNYFAQATQEENYKSLKESKKQKSANKTMPIKNNISKTNSADLKKLSNIQKSSNLVTMHNFEKLESYLVNYVDTTIHNRLVNFMFWMILAQVFTAVIFAIFYIDLLYKIKKKLKLEKQTNIQTKEIKEESIIKKEDIVKATRQMNAKNLRKALL